MINLKKILNAVLNNKNITDIIGADNIFCGYPNEVQKFPCLCFVEDNQSDIEFADNIPIANDCRVSINIFTKKLNGEMTTSEISAIVGDVMKKDFWTCIGNNEVPDVNNEVEHRVLNYKKEFLS